MEISTTASVCQQVFSQHHLGVNGVVLSCASVGIQHSLTLTNWRLSGAHSAHGLGYYCPKWILSHKLYIANMREGRESEDLEQTSSIHDAPLANTPPLINKLANRTSKLLTAHASLSLWQTNFPKMFVIIFDGHTSKPLGGFPCA